MVVAMALLKDFIDIMKDSARKDRPGLAWVLGLFVISIALIVSGLLKSRYPKRVAA